MNDRKKMINEVYEYLRAYYGVHTQKDFAAALHVTRSSLSSAMNGNEAYLTNSLFQKICATYPGVFDLEYLTTGEGTLLLEHKEEKQNRNVDHSSLINALLAAKDETIDLLKSQIEVKDKLIKVLEQTILDLKIQINQMDCEKIKEYPFRPGIAETEKKTIR